MFGFHSLFLTFFICHFQFTLCHQFAKAHDHIDLVFPHQELYTLAHLIGHAAAPFDDGRKIWRAGSLYPEILCMLDILIHLGAFQQGFGGNATPVETNTPEAFFFNNRSFKTKLGCPDSGHITARPATKNHYVVCHFSDF